MSFCIRDREQMSFHEDKFCLFSTPTDISPQPGHLQKASNDSSIVITESGRREKQECCTEVYSLMWNLIEHDSTEICHRNGDELVLQVYQQLTKRHSTLTSLHQADTTVANVPPPQSLSHSAGFQCWTVCRSESLQNHSYLFFKLIFFFFWCRDLLGMSFPFQSSLFLSESLCEHLCFIYAASVFPFFAVRLAVIIFAQFFEQHLHESFCSTANPLFKVFCHEIYKLVSLLRRRSRLTQRDKQTSDEMWQVRESCDVRLFCDV